jgi:DNA polymerase III gamma/tau subunit
MIKKITLITAWIFTVSIFNSSAQDVSVNVDMPATTAPESTFRVTLTVNKGDVSGFAKLEQLLPAGLDATAVDVANSTFTFKDRKAKFLWMSLPAETTFKVSYDVKVAAGTSGNQIMEGTFAYILNNETQKYALPKSIINIGAAEVVNNEVKVNVVETPHNNPEAEKAKEEAAAKAAADKAAYEAKSASEKAAADAAAAEKANKELAASIKKKQEEEKKAADALAKKQQQEAASLEKKQQAKTEVAVAVNVKEGKPVDGLVFRAQVAAGKKKVAPSVFQGEYKISDEIFWEEHDGWNKYTVGNFNSYRAAKTFANEIRDNNGVTGSFVVAYNKGSRISVQEALNLSGGK